MLLFVGILIAICSAAILTAGLLAAVRNNEKRENRWFLVLCATVAAWVAANYADSNLTLGDNLAHALIRIDFALALIIAWTLVQFVVNLTYDYAKTKPWMALLVERPYIIASVVLNLFAIALIVRDEVVLPGFDDGMITAKPGPLFSWYVLLLATYFVAAFGTLVVSYLHGNRNYKRRLSMIVSGFLVAVFANVLTNLILPNIIEQRSTVQAFNTIGYAGIFFLVFCIYTAITTRKLFDIRFVITRSLVYLLFLIVIGVFYAGTITLLGRVAFGGGNVSTSSLLTSLAVTLFIASTYQYLKKIVDKTTNRIFFQDAYEPQTVLDRLTHFTTSTTDLDRLISHTTSLIEQTLKASYCDFALVDKNKKITYVSTNASVRQDKLIRVVSHALHSHRMIITELLQEDNETYRLLRLISAELVIPLYTTEGALGVMILGTKQNGHDYVQKDLTLLTIATSNLSVAIQNARRFEEIERFNETLQQRVDDATRQLRHANKRLKQLNDSKDDFIGMTSHQLRTPLTSIKGYISLVMDGDAGKVSETQRKLLQQAFTSSQKMVYLIADLLNVSRLKTGKFVVERTPTDLSKLITDEMSQLQEEAKLRGLELTFKAPRNFPQLPLDETKTRQVIMNFMDNAIYYTPSGGHVRVELTELPASIEFRVSDDGIGVPKEEVPHLFTKFYRAKNAQRSRPDGTGLGLYMAQKVVVAQGGAIIFSSKEGQGSTFGFSFPKDLPTGNTSLPIQVSD